jgi:hypothetical protein
MTAVACMDLERLRTRRRCMKLLNGKALPYAANVRREPRAASGTPVSTARFGGISFTDELPLVPAEMFTNQSRVV